MRTSSSLAGSKWRDSGWRLYWEPKKLASSHLRYENLWQHSDALAKCKYCTEIWSTVLLKVTGDAATRKWQLGSSHRVREIRASLRSRLPRKSLGHPSVDQPHVTRLEFKRLGNDMIYIRYNLLLLHCIAPYGNTTHFGHKSLARRDVLSIVDLLAQPIVLPSRDVRVCCSIAPICSSIDSNKRP